MCKKILLRLATIIIASVFTVFAVSGAEKASPKIKFEKLTHDFGTIKASEGPVTAKYEFTNTGDAPLVIINVTQGGCGCTKPAYPKEPIAQGQKNVITITFDPTGRRGEFNREVKVKTNAGKRIPLRFSGVIVP